MILVTGGAGYIGSHVVRALETAGHAVVVLDDLSTGSRSALDGCAAELVTGDAGDGGLVRTLLEGHRVRAVLHFAGSILVPESVERPLAYYRNNTASSLALIEAAVAAGVEGLVFSSTAAVYGEPDQVPVAEDASLRPLSPYGRSKLMTEQMLVDAGAAHGLRHVVLRYFNVAGAGPSSLARSRAPHLIKVACQVALGQRPAVPVYGDDYPTPDGTCVRDYIHVMDLADAHVRALEHLLGGGPSLTLNCGYGRGQTVRQVIEAVGRVTGRPLPVARAPRRPGDAAAVIADVARIRERLAWHPRYDDLERIVVDSLALEQRLLAASG